MYKKNVRLLAMLSMSLLIAGEAEGAAFRVRLSVTDDCGRFVANKTANVTVGAAGAEIVELSVTQSFEVRITNLGANNCPGGNDPVGRACLGGASTRYRVSTISTGIPKGYRLAFLVDKFGGDKPCQCSVNAKYDMLGCCVGVVGGAGPARGTRVHEFELITPPAQILEYSQLGVPVDCDGNGVDDAETIAAFPILDCNNNAILDECEITAGTALDVDGNGIPDACDAAAVCVVPAASTWGMLTLLLLLVTASSLVLKRRLVAVGRHS